MFHNKKQKIRKDSLICLTNPEISHRWGSEARNSPLVALTHHTRRLRPCFVTLLESYPNVILVVQIAKLLRNLAGIFA